MEDLASQYAEDHPVEEKETATPAPAASSAPPAAAPAVQTAAAPASETAKGSVFDSFMEQLKVAKSLGEVKTIFFNASQSFKTKAVSAEEYQKISDEATARRADFGG